MMKHSRRVLCMLLALLMVFGLFSPVTAYGETEYDGVTVVDNIVSATETDERTREGAGTLTPFDADRAVGRNFFVSSSLGHDDNPGTYEAPWKSLRNVNATQFQPGDRIFFRAGDEWRGQLAPQGFGTDANPIIIDMYGPLAVPGNLRDYPAIHGMGGEGLCTAGYPITDRGHWEQGWSGTVMMVNTTNWTIRHLQITNDNPDPVTGEFVFRDNEHFAFRQRHPHARTQGDGLAAPAGGTFNQEAGNWDSARPGRGMNLLSFCPIDMSIINERNGIMAIVNPDLLPEDVDVASFRVRNLNIEHLYIHNVDGIQHWGRLYGDARFQGAILAHMEGSAVPGVTFENLSIYNNVMNKVGTMGIALFDFADHNYFQQFYRHADRSMKNVYIGYNYATNILGGAMNLCNMDGALIEFNVMDHWGRDYSRECAGVYTWQGNNVWYANNIVSNGPNQLRGGADGGAWDIDSGLYNVIHEFNYTFNNPMGTVTWLGRNFGSIFRYNIADNDKRAFIVDGWYDVDFDDTWFINNIIYFDSSRAPASGIPNMRERSNPTTETFRLHSPPDSHMHRSRGGHLMWVNNIFYDFGHQGGEDSLHWFFQGFTQEYINTAAQGRAWYNIHPNWDFPHSSVWWNNNFFFANLADLPVEEAEARLAGNVFNPPAAQVDSAPGVGSGVLETVQPAIGPWMMEGPQAAFRNQNNTFMVDPLFVGISGTKDDIPTLPRAAADGQSTRNPLNADRAVVLRAPGRPNLNVENSVLPREQTIATQGHAGHPFPEQLGRVMNVGDPFWGKFQLQPNSPMIDAGRYVPQMGEYDFFGTQLYYGTAPDLGIYEHRGTEENPKTRADISDRHDIRGGQAHVRQLRDLANPDIDTTQMEPLQFWNIGGALTPRHASREGNLAFRREVTASVTNNMAYHLTNDLASPSCMEWGLTSMWNSGNMEAQWLEIDFGREVTFDTVRLFEWFLSPTAQNWTATGNAARGDVLRPNLVHYSYSFWNGTEWVEFHDNAPDLDRRSTNAHPDGFIPSNNGHRNTHEATFLEDRFAPVTTSRLRIDLNELSGIVYLYQIEVYNRSHDVVSAPSQREDVAVDAMVATEPGVTVFTLDAPTRLNRIRLFDANNAITSYTVSVQEDGTWIEVGTGGALGRDNLFFAYATANRIMVTYTANGTPNLSLGAFLEPGFAVQRTEEPTLEAHWVMSERIGNTIPDLSGNNRRLVANNIRWETDANRGEVARFGAGRDGIAASTNDNTLSMSDSAFPVAMYEQYTISMWIRPDGVYMGPFAPTNGRRMQTLFIKGTDGSEAMRADMEYQGITGQFQSPHRFVNLNSAGENGTGQIRFWPSFQGSSDPTMFAQTNAWNHVAFTWDGYYYRIFVNGNLTQNNRIRCPITETARPIRANAAPLLFGNRATGPAISQFFGSMDDIRLYSTALTQEQILAQAMMVTFDAGGGRGTMEPVVVADGTFTLPANGFTPPTPDFAFAGWQVSGVDEVLQPGDTIDVTGPVVVTATWALILTLTPEEVTIDDENETATVTVGGVADGEIVLDISDLPDGVTATVDQETGVITITGTRPTTDVPPITGTFVIGVTRGGVTEEIEVAVNLTTTYEPPTPPTPPTVDRDALRDTLEEAAELTEQGAYSDASWAAFVAARDAAQAVYDDPDATQEEIAAATAALRAALDGLRKLHAAYMFGNPAGQFLPGHSITRAEVAAILARTMIDDFDSSVDREDYELPEGMESFDVFPDVSESNWFYHYVAWAHYEGFVQGDAQGRFNPTSPITRQELAAMLARTIAEEDRVETGDMAFPDADTIGGWARGYVYNVFRQGWMVGDAQGYFRPAADIMRAEVATAVNRLLGRVDTNDLRNALVADDALEYESRAREFPDVAATNWFFAAVLAAANDHYLTHDDEGVVDWMYVCEEQPWHE